MQENLRKISYYQKRAKFLRLCMAKFWRIFMKIKKSGRPIPKVVAQEITKYINWPKKVMPAVRILTTWGLNRWGFDEKELENSYKEYDSDLRVEILNIN